MFGVDGCSAPDKLTGGYSGVGVPAPRIGEPGRGSPILNTLTLFDKDFRLNTAKRICRLKIGNDPHSHRRSASVEGCSIASSIESQVVCPKHVCVVLPRSAFEGGCVVLLPGLRRSQE